MHALLTLVPDIGLYRHAIKKTANIIVKKLKKFNT